ncbi:hypothetical protein ABFG93_19710 [Pseudalkalibacillus hwajinpoensis]
MNEKPIHFDGSSIPHTSTVDSKPDQTFKVTDEMRKVISCNPYELSQK